MERNLSNGYSSINMMSFDTILVSNDVILVWLAVVAE